MSAWGSLSKAVSRYLGKGASAPTGTWTKTWTSNGTRNVMTVTKGISTAGQNAASTVLTWGNAFKVAVVGAFSYLFLTGGASNVVSRTLGISPEAAQVIVVFAFVVVLLVLLRYLLTYVRDRLGITNDGRSGSYADGYRRIRDAYRPEDDPVDHGRFRRCSG